MSSYPELIGHFWPWNTLRSAYLAWQAQESRLVKARQRLALEYQAACRQAEQLAIDTGQGILRTARSLLDQPHDPPIVRVRNRLDRMFVLRGRGWFRRTPSILAVELSAHAANIEAICRSQNNLVDRLRLARAILTLCSSSPEFCSSDLLRLIVISPESAKLLLQLRLNRRRDRQTIQGLLLKQ